MAGVFPPVIIQHSTIKCTQNYILYKKLKPKVWGWIMSFNWKDEVTLQVLKPTNSWSLKNLMNEVSRTQFCWSLPGKWRISSCYFLYFKLEYNRSKCCLYQSIYISHKRSVENLIKAHLLLWTFSSKLLIYLWNNLWRKFLPHALDTLHMLLIDTICLSSKALIAFF